MLRSDLAFRRFPPKNAKPHYPDVAQPFVQSPPPAIFPDGLTAQSEIWDEEKRGSLKKPKFKKKDLDDRRSKVGTIHLALVYLLTSYV